jgi:hypothetical protein
VPDFQHMVHALYAQQVHLPITLAFSVTEDMENMKSYIGQKIIFSTPKQLPRDLAGASNCKSKSHAELDPHRGTQTHECQSHSDVQEEAHAYIRQGQKERESTRQFWEFRDNYAILYENEY